MRLRKNRILIYLALLILAFSYFIVKEYKNYADKPTHVVIGDAGQPVFGLIYVAHDRGFFTEQDLDVELKKYELGKDALAGVLNGEADFAGVFGVPFIQAISDKNDILALTSLNIGSSNAGMVKRSGLDKNLSGKTFGVVENTNMEFTLNSILLENGIPESDVNIRYYNFPDLIKSFEANDIDAVMLPSTQLYAYEGDSTFDPNNILYSGIYAEVSFLVGESEYIHANKEVCEKILLALEQSYQYIIENPAESQEIITRYIDSPYDDMVKNKWDSYEFTLGFSNIIYTTLQNQRDWIVKKAPKTEENTSNLKDKFFIEPYVGSLQVFETL